MAVTHKIETDANGTIRTRTASRFVGVRERADDVFVAHAVTKGGSWVEVARATVAGNAHAAGVAGAKARGVEFERMEVSKHAAFAEVVKRSDSAEVCRKAVVKAGGGFVFDTVAGERV